MIFVLLYHGTTTAAIAARAGVNEALIYRHFPAKGDVYTAILRDRIENDANALRGLRKQQWATFAAAYNGTDYWKYVDGKGRTYAQNMAAAYAALTAKTPRGAAAR